MADKGDPTKNLEAILKFCIENTGAEDTTKPSDFSNMDPERREWLQKALEEYILDDETLIIKKCLEILSTSDGTLSPNTEEDLMTRETTLEQLEAVVDIIDNANDCYQLGGFGILLKYLDHHNTSLQWRAASVLGLCFQNNTYGQDQALKMNVLPKLVELIHSQTSDEQVNVKSLFALAGLIRGHGEAERLFVASNGLSHLLRALELNIPKLTTKTIFLLSNLIEEKNEHIETLYNMGIVSQLINIIQSPHDRHHEHAFNVLLKIATNCPEALQDCRQEKYGLRETLTARIDYLKTNDPLAYAEELELCNKLLKLCFDNTEAMDR